LQQHINSSELFSQCFQIKLSSERGWLLNS
jgi:hypothetical protein